MAFVFTLVYYKSSNDAESCLFRFRIHNAGIHPFNFIDPFNPFQLQAESSSERRLQVSLTFGIVHAIRPNLR